MSVLLGVSTWNAASISVSTDCPTSQNIHIDALHFVQISALTVMLLLYGVSALRRACVAVFEGFELRISTCFVPLPGQHASLFIFQRMCCRKANLAHDVRAMVRSRPAIFFFNRLHFEYSRNPSLGLACASQRRRVVGMLPSV